MELRADVVPKTAGQTTWTRSIYHLAQYQQTQYQQTLLSSAICNQQQCCKVERVRRRVYETEYSMTFILHVGVYDAGVARCHYSCRAN